MTIPTADLRWFILRDTLDASESSADPVQIILLLEQGRAMIEQLLTETVGYARHKGHTWEELGKALGITKQGAWIRFASETQHKGMD